MTGVVVLAVLSWLTPIALGTLRPDALPGTVLTGVRESGEGVGPDASGVDVGGLDGEQLETAVVELAHARLDEEITVEWEAPEGAVADDERLTVTAGELGYDVDIDETVQRIRGRGRQVNPITAWSDHIASIRNGIAVPVASSFDEGRAEAWAQETADDLALDPEEGEVTLEGASVSRRDPETGARIDADELAGELAQAAATPGEATLTPEVEALEPETTTETVDAGVAAAETAIDGDIVLARGDGEVRLSPEQIGDLFDVERSGGDFALDLDTDGLAETIDDETVEAIERDPISSEITLEGGAIQISDSRQGFAFDLDTAAAQVEAIAAGEGDREQELDVEIVEPERSREEAEDIGIEEVISEFTTEYTAGEPRARNIQRIADMVDGEVVEPGETFSVNDHVGPRTEEAGFEADGTIIDGELEEQVGGGVSQFATTMYNAIYFGGYEFLVAQPHSYYISRYPAGREATLHYDLIDLEFRNDSPYGLLIDTSHTADSVTVRIWSTEWVEVEAEASDRTRHREGQTIDGFDITVTRILRYPDGTVEREPRHTRYEPTDQ
ncbi:VanW family protein [Egibacter rhizosphaerae]|uniref:VanW family protein n=1 Tax=Egibacter rhizosphaerae TaxID=1670831 RepID=UPI0013F162C0|nr:VanW family protein [Egibacter rhizosphaerae]